MIILQQTGDAKWYFGVNSLPYVKGNTRTYGCIDLNEYIYNRMITDINKFVISSSINSLNYAVIGPEEFFL